ncbi:MAG: (Fe-S)-binding protein [Planctomycetota bacterium]|jgi:L-lactate dehydrogenase complex protein LldE
MLASPEGLGEDPGVRVALFVTCLVDQIGPEVGMATVAVLERAGCEVVFEPGQTCCGQPAYNSGHRDHARRCAEAYIESFERSGCEVAVSPSGSCAAMVHHFPRLFADDPAWRSRAEAMAHATHELSVFLVDVLGRVDLGASFVGRATWHDACHGLRELGIRDQPRQLLRAVRGLELVELGDAEACCGFGGTFAVKYPEVSVSITDRKCARIAATGADVVVSGDLSCLMQIGGRLSREGSPTRVLHLAEILASTGGEG